MDIGKILKRCCMASLLFMFPSCGLDAEIRSLNSAQKSSTKHRRIDKFNLISPSGWTHGQVHFVLYFPKKNRAFLLGYYLAHHNKSEVGEPSFSDYSFMLVDLHVYNGCGWGVSNGYFKYDTMRLSCLKMEKGLAKYTGWGYVRHEAPPCTGPDIWPQKLMKVFIIESDKIFDEIVRRITKDEISLNNSPPLLVAFDLSEILKYGKRDDLNRTEELRKMLRDSPNWSGVVWAPASPGFHDGSGL